MTGFANIKNYFDNLKGQTMTNELTDKNKIRANVMEQSPRNICHAIDLTMDAMLEASPTPNVEVVGYTSEEMINDLRDGKDSTGQYARNGYDKNYTIPLYTHPAPPNTVDKAAYDGAREDLAIWKKRALEAENKVKIYDQRIVDIGAIAMKPVKVKQPPNTVSMPQNEEEAEAMEKIGYAWLRDNAPHRLVKKDTDEQLKDAERLEYLINPENVASLHWMKRPNKPMKFRIMVDGEYETGWHLSAREAIDKAREGKS